MKDQEKISRWDIPVRAFLLIRAAASFGISSMVLVLIAQCIVKDIREGDPFSEYGFVLGVYIYVLCVQYTDMKMPWQ